MAELFLRIAFRAMTYTGIKGRAECSDGTGEFQVRYGLVKTADNFFGKFKFGVCIVLMTFKAF